MIQKVDVGYIGFSCAMLNELLDSPFFNVKICISEKSKTSEQMKRICKSKDIALFRPVDKAEMTKTLLSMPELTDFVMYESGIIIEQAGLKKKHIYNFHPGSFINNRGAHPIVWSILSGDPFTEMTMYEIDAEIDHGTKIDTRIVPVARTDDVGTLKTKLESTISELLVSLYSHILKRQYAEKQSNQYNRRVEEADYIIDLNSDSMERMIRKIQSQRAYDGPF